MFCLKVAIAYLMQKTPYVFPIIGGRKVEHMIANLEALEISLSEDQIKYLESVVPFEPGFPHWIIVSFLFPFFFMEILQSIININNNLFIFFCVAPQGDGRENVPMAKFSTTITKGPLLQPLRPAQ